MVVFDVPVRWRSAVERWRRRHPQRAAQLRRACVRWTWASAVLGLLSLLLGVLVRLEPGSTNGGVSAGLHRAVIAEFPRWWHISTFPCATSWANGRTQRRATASRRPSGVSATSSTSSAASSDRLNAAAKPSSNNPRSRWSINRSSRGWEPNTPERGRGPT
jgi:hypothetical protein